MAERTTYTCDECGKTKGESNHWYRAVVVGSQIAFGPWEYTSILQVDASEHQERHLCGQKCAIQLLSKTIGVSRA